jgi:hypothetical protein
MSTRAKTLKEQNKMTYFYNDDFNYRHDLFSKGVGTSTFFDAIEKELPPVFSRQVASQKIGGLIAVKTLSNLDSLDKGPSVKVRIGSKVGYERSNFIAWLKEKMRSKGF